MIFNWFVFAALASSAVALRNGVGKLPKMGYDTFNAFACTYNATIALSQAQAMVKHGLVAAGYDSFILDDCYTLKNRSSEGMLVAGG
jgi:alpha-galactosidase